MSSQRYEASPTKEGGVIVTINGHRMSSNDGWGADKWNDEAVYWREYGGMRQTDVALLAAQYLYAGESETWSDIRPVCTWGTVGSGWCPNETVEGGLNCGKHSQVGRR